MDQEQYTIKLPQEIAQELMEILGDLYINSPEARRVARHISPQLGGVHEELVDEMDSDFPEEVSDTRKDGE